jgi:hypothetical protein
LELAGRTRAAVAFPDNVWTKTEIRYISAGPLTLPSVNTCILQGQKFDHITYSNGLHFHLCLYFMRNFKIKWYKFHVHVLYKEATENAMALPQNGYLTGNL